MGGRESEEGGEGRREDGGGTAAPVDFQDVSLCCVRMPIDLICFTRGSLSKTQKSHRLSHTHIDARTAKRTFRV